jgi:hypothetical protein
MRNYDIDSFKEYRTDNTIVGNIVNNQKNFNNKDVILGFNINNNQYAILESTITDNTITYSDNVINIEVSKNKGEFIISSINQEGKTQIKEYTTSYAFVWFDFFPSTKKISISTNFID